MKFARRFFDAREIEGDARSLMNLHNNRAGRKVIFDKYLFLLVDFVDKELRSALLRQRKSKKTFRFRKDRKKAGQVIKCKIYADALVAFFLASSNSTA